MNRCVLALMVLGLAGCVHTGTVVEPSAITSRPNPSAAWSRNSGKISRLYPSGSGVVFFRLSGGQTAMRPKDGYYYISCDHPNYEALVELLYLAAEQSWTVSARTYESLDDNGHARVSYIVVDPPDKRKEEPSGEQSPAGDRLKAPPEE